LLEEGQRQRNRFQGEVYIGSRTGNWGPICQGLEGRAGASPCQSPREEQRVPKTGPLSEGGSSQHIYPGDQIYRDMTALLKYLKGCLIKEK
jgi:hypothetical protein